MAHLVWLAIPALLLFTSCSDEDDSGRGRGGQRWSGGPAFGAAAVPVRAEPVIRGTITAFVETHARLEAERWVDVLARTTGLVTKITVEEGDRVVVGQVLARLDQEESKLRIRQVEVALEQARVGFKRTKELFERQLVSEEEYDAAKHHVQDIEVDLEEARFDFSHTVIRAPLAGLVMRRATEVGRLIRTNDQLFSLADVEPLLARIHIPEKRMRQVRVGQRAQLAVDSYSDRQFDATVRMINPGVDPESGTVKVTLEVPPSSQRLKPGMFASVYIITETHEDALVIPKKSLVLEGEGNQIFIYKENKESGMGKATRRKVEVGFADNEWLEVLSGISDTDRVITVGQEGLRPGTAVRLVGAGAVASGGRKGERDSTSASGRMGGDRNGQRGDGAGNRGLSGASVSDLEAIKGMQERMFGRFPDLKKAYEEQLKKDPELATNLGKWRAFLGQMREKGVLPARRGG